jgi:N-acetylated-alpha-linked acidic dipeptidase
VKTIPAVREAIEQKQWKRAEEQISVIASVLKEETSIINEAAKELEAMVNE